MKQEETPELWMSPIDLNAPDAESVFKMIYDRLAMPLTFYARHFIGREEDADDMVMNAFTILWENRSKVDTYGTAKSYLYTIVKTRCINFLRDERRKMKSHKEIQYLSQHDEDQLATFEIDVSIYQKLKEHIEALKGNRKEVFTMAYLRHLPDRFIAQSLEISESTVRSHKRHAMEQLRKSLGADFQVALIILMVALEKGDVIPHLLP